MGRSSADTYTLEVRLAQRERETYFSQRCSWLPLVKHRME